MLLGHAAEILIIMVLEENGWETAHTVLSEDGQLELSIALNTNRRNLLRHLRLSAIPDNPFGRDGRHVEPAACLRNRVGEPLGV